MIVLRIQDVKIASSGVIRESPQHHFDFDHGARWVVSEKWEPQSLKLLFFLLEAVGQRAKMADLLPPGQWQVWRASDVCGGKKDLAMAWPRCQCGGTSNAQVGHCFFDICFFLDGYPVTSPGLTVGFLMFFHVSGSFSLELIEESDYPVVNEGWQLERLGYPYSEKFPIFHGEPVGATDCCNLKAQGGHDRRIRSRGRPARFYCTNFSHARFILIWLV